MQFLQALLGGLGPGAIYAIAGLGIVVTYRVSGVVNFSQGAVAMATAYVFWDFHDEHSLGLALAIVLSLLFAIVLGVISHVILYLMRGAAVIQQVIATLGILIVIQWSIVLGYGSDPRIMTSILPQHVVKLGSVTIGLDRLIIFGLALLLALVLFAIYRYTSFGRITAVVTENPILAASCGYSAVRVAATNFAISSLLAGGAGILVAPIVGLDPNTLTYLIVPVLAATVVGDFRSFGLSVAGALVIGVAETEGVTYINQPGIGRAMPFIFIVAILIIRGRSLPGRDLIRRRLPKVSSGVINPRVTITFVLLGAVLLSIGLPAEWITGISVSVGYAIVCLSVVVLTGYTGQITLCQYALAGVGAFIAGRLVATHAMSLAPAALIAVVITVPVGVLIGVPALRTRGISLAVATLSVGFVIDAVVFENYGWTGGSVGTVVGEPKLFGWSIDSIAHPERYAWVAYIGFIVCAVVVTNLRRGLIGRKLIAVRENERAASALGISVGGTKLYAFGVAAGIAALGGVVIAFRYNTIDFTTFPPLQSILLVGAVVLGGAGYTNGALIGALALAPAGVGAVIGRHIGGIENYIQLIGGIALIEVLLVHPSGIANDLAGLGNRLSPALVRLRDRLRAPPLRTRSSQPADPAPDSDVRPLARPMELTISDLTVRFGGVVAVSNASLVVQPGEVVGLIGPNGAGKSTLIDAASGFNQPESGEIMLGTSRLQGRSATHRARAGLSRSFQSLELFEDMTVEDNLRVACEVARPRSYLTELLRPSRPPLSPEAWAAIREFDLADDLSKLPAELPYSRRRLVAIARAVASLPSILMLDEPAGGLDEHERQELGALVRRLADEWRIGVLIVEHDIELIMGICDRVNVLRFGEVIASGTPDEVRRDPSVIAAYIGGPATAVAS